MDLVEVPIEETVELDRNFPRVHERYFKDYYYVPVEKNKLEQGSCDSNEAKDGANSTNGSDFTESQEENLVEEKNPKEDSRNDTCVLLHTNKLCLLTLSHHHPVLSKKKEITKVNFDVGKFNRLENQVSGKGKRGAQMIGPRSQVCIITCTDGSTYTILAGVNGKLIEVNERLQSKPELLTDTPREEGYLAIILPPLHNGKMFSKERLLSREQYEDFLVNHTKKREQ